MKKNLIHRTEYRDIDSILQLLAQKTQGLKDALENAHYQSIESIDIKTTYIAAGTGLVTRGVRHLDKKVDLQREEIHSVSIAAQNQHAMLRSQNEKMNKLISSLEALGDNKSVIANANSKWAGEAAEEDFGAWLLNKITDALIAQKSMFTRLKYVPPGHVC